MTKIAIKSYEKWLKEQEISIPGKRRFGRIMIVEFKCVKGHQELVVHVPRSMRAKPGPAEGSDKAQIWISGKTDQHPGLLPQEAVSNLSSAGCKQKMDSGANKTEESRASTDVASAAHTND